MTYRLFSLFVALFLLSGSATATSVFDQLARPADNERTALRLTVPVDSLAAKTSADQPAHLSFATADGPEIAYDLEVALRGKFRRRRCANAPLKLNFSKKDLRAAGLTEYDKYKLVLPCFDAPEAEDLVLKEYLAYRAYAHLSPYSFRTQLLDLTIVDAHGNNAERTVTAFLIEATDELATRLQLTEVDAAHGLPASAYDEEAEATHALFQFMVGNGDWSLALHRNVKIFRMEDGSLVPVGYDFDFTGWVGAPYASPTRDVGQSSIYDRVYLGYAHDDAVMDAALERFRDRRQNIIGLLKDSELAPEERLRTQRFASRFFSQINRLRTNDERAVYDQLRGGTAVFIPSGSAAESYQLMGR